MSELQEKISAVAVTEQQAEPGLLDQILTKGMRAKDEIQTKRGRNLISDFVAQVITSPFHIVRVPRTAGAVEFRRLSP